MSTITDLSSQRIAFVVSALSGTELTGGNRDVSTINSLFTDPEIGHCDPSKSKLLPNCKLSDFDNSLKHLLKNWKTSDQLIFYFSGHGTIKHEKYVLEFGGEYYPFANLVNYLSISPVQRAILIIDACFSGAATDAFHGKKGDIPKGIAILTSSRATEQSEELTGGVSSVFTHLFCEAINTLLNDRKTSKEIIITADDIFQYVTGKLESNEYKTYSQRPLYSIDKATDPIWIVKRKPTPSTVEISAVGSFYALGVDIGTTKIAAGLVELSDIKDFKPKVSNLLELYHGI